MDINLARMKHYKDIKVSKELTWTDGMMYVALSRCKKLEQIRFLEEFGTYMDPATCTADPLVKKFYNSIAQKPCFWA